MNHWLGIVAALAFGVSTPAAEDPVEAQLVRLEKQSWAAWKDRDGAFYDRFLSDDHLEIGAYGVGNKAQVVAFVGSAACTVESYSLGAMRFQRIDERTALLAYRSDQKAVCGGAPVEPAWVTSLYVNRGGRWQNVLYQRTAAAAR
jgi:hypothetical protein